MADVSLQLSGVHNVLNSLAVIATVGALIDDQKLPYLNFSVSLTFSCLVYLKLH
ncbi:hypothetical protein Syun_000755 [Stephania yunnanensis]|uniref:Uncharacterized protein n=1 Tax=Stephania yunnanensis TaxID=152371 RepID=A0AAP0LFE0_9MAGN